jgi:DTW domain-containing protein YfiP
VLILQHPQEQDFELGSAPLVVAALPSARLAIGLSWRSLSHAWGEETARGEWAVVYPSSLPRPLSAAERTRPMVLIDQRGAEVAAGDIGGVVVLDGTWSQAKAIWWRNPWLLKLHRIVLHPQEPSIYGKLRKEPRRGYVSTLEAVAEALHGLGEDPAVRTELRRLFRTMVQRARDAGT